MKKRFAHTGDVTRAINDAFSAARQFRESAEQIDARMTAIREELRSKTPRGKWRYSEYMRHYSEGYTKARYDDIWQHVEFCYRDAAGVLYSTHRDSTHRKTEEFYSSGRGAELSTLPGAHVWKGTDRNYTPWGRHGSEPHTVS
jgi:hypothetical protein